MIFNTLQFIPFILIVLFVHRISPWKFDKLFLLLISYLFYASFNPPYVIILLVSTLIDYWAGKNIYKRKNVQARRFFLAISCLCNLGILCFFKYTDFLLENVGHFSSWAGFGFETPRLNFLLPVGISFYTFQSMSYTIDIYRKKMNPASFVDFALYVSFFTQLVAGPIVRAVDFLPQLKRKRIPGFTAVSYGFYLIILGFFKKIVIADNLAVFAGKFFANPSGCSSDALCGILSFAIQIYCDFSGYSDIAIGISLIMGFHLRRNFRVPYLSQGIADFWRRWHISLSFWIRDYVYIPLGGNRCGFVRRNLNLMLTMTLCGLWHGASWMFIIWGVYHSLLLIAERGYTKISSMFIDKYSFVQYIKDHLLYKMSSIFLTFSFVCIGWIFFRAENFDKASKVFKALFNNPFSICSIFESMLSFDFVKPEWFYIVLIFIIHLVVFVKKEFMGTKRIHWFFYSVISGIMSFFIFTAWESNNVFIYFQF